MISGLSPCLLFIDIQRAAVRERGQLILGAESLQNKISSPAPCGSPVKRLPEIIAGGRLGKIPAKRLGAARRDCHLDTRPENGAIWT